MSRLTLDSMILKKCRGKFECLIYEMLFIKNEHSIWLNKAKTIEYLINTLY